MGVQSDVPGDCRAFLNYMRVGVDVCFLDSCMFSFACVRCFIGAVKLSMEGSIWEAQ